MKTVFVSGNFNVLHPGHLRILRFARDLGDRLVVGVISDDLGSPSVHVPENLRLEGVECNSWVDEAFIVKNSVLDTIKKLRPDIVVKGKEHQSKFNPEKEILSEYGGELIFSSGEQTFSSLDLIRKDVIIALPQKIPEGYLRRRGVSDVNIMQIVKDFKSLRVCVIGDLIMDEYLDCEPLGMSQEDPTLVVTPVDKSRFLGGAGIVAAHAAGLGAKVSLVSLTGADEIRDDAQKRLNHYEVNCRLMIDKSRPTTLKQRFRATGKTLLRVSHLHQTSPNQATQDELVKNAKEIIEASDVLVFSDFNYGCLPQPVVDQLVQFGREKKIVMAADSQCSSQVGDICRFKHMNLITPTEREARISLRSQEDGLVFICDKLRQKSKATHIILKLGPEGILVNEHGNNSEEQTDRIPSLNSNPADVAGAGDSLLITSAMALARNHDIWKSAAIGSYAAALQVGRVGNSPLSPDEFRSILS
jgi:rfaE bifunctional protein kinase chain/domain